MVMSKPSSGLYTFLKQDNRSVERFRVKAWCSGTTVWRFGLMFLGLLSFFSISIYIGNRMSYSSNAALSFIDNQYFFAYYIFLAAFSFAMIPLCDFNIFPYNHKFWDVFKSIGTYLFLLETEGICHYVYRLDDIFDWTEFDNLEWNIMWDFILLSCFRWVFLAGFLYQGYKILGRIIELRALEPNFYVSVYSNLFEFAIFHGFGGFLVWTDYTFSAVLLIVVTMIIVYFVFRYCIFFVNQNYDDEDIEFRKRYSKLNS